MHLTTSVPNAYAPRKVSPTGHIHVLQEAQLMLTNLRDALRGQSMSPT